MSTPIKPFGPPLTAEEEARLAECEAIIKVGLQNFVETGSALKEISDNRLYRKTHSDFDSYVKELWQMNARQAYRLIESADVVKQLESVTNLSQTQINPNQARALGKIPPAERAAVLEKVSGQGKVTARAIQEAIEVERPPTLDAQLLSALDMKEAKPLDEVFPTGLEKLCEDVDFTFSQAKGVLTAPDLAKFKLHAEIGLRKLRPQ